VIAELRVLGRGLCECDERERVFGCESERKKGGGANEVAVLAFASPPPLLLLERALSLSIPNPQSHDHMPTR
jgi:hypothetical protein